MNYLNPMKLMDQVKFLKLIVAYETMRRCQKQFLGLSPKWTHPTIVTGLGLKIKLQYKHVNSKLRLKFRILDPHPSVTN